MSITHLLVLLIIFALVVFLPVLIFGAVCRKAGFSKWSSILLIVPILNIALIWVFAYIKWPAIDRSA